MHTLGSIDDVKWAILHALHRELFAAEHRELFATDFDSIYKKDVNDFYNLASNLLDKSFTKGAKGFSYKKTESEFKQEIINKLSDVSNIKAITDIPAVDKTRLVNELTVEITNSKINLSEICEKFNNMNDYIHWLILKFMCNKNANIQNETLVNYHTSFCSFLGHYADNKNIILSEKVRSDLKEITAKNQGYLSIAGRLIDNACPLNNLIMPNESFFSFMQSQQIPIHTAVLEFFCEKLPGFLKYRCQDLDDTIKKQFESALKIFQDEKDSSGQIQRKYYEILCFNKTEYACFYQSEVARGILAYARYHIVQNMQKQKIDLKEEVVTKASEEYRQARKFQFEPIMSMQHSKDFSLFKQGASHTVKAEQTYYIVSNSSKILKSDSNNLGDLKFTEELTNSLLQVDNGQSLRVFLKEKDAVEYAQSLNRENKDFEKIAYTAVFKTKLKADIVLQPVVADKEEKELNNEYLLFNSDGIDKIDSREVYVKKWYEPVASDNQPSKCLIM